MSSVTSSDGRRPIRVIVAKDDDLVRTMIVDGLAQSDVPMEVTSCTDGVKALAFVRALRAAGQSVDLLALDIEMQVMHGDQVAEAVRQDERERQQSPVPIVFVTGFAATNERLVAALQNGALATCIHKQSCRDGIEMASRIAELAREGLST